MAGILDRIRELLAKLFGGTDVQRRLRTLGAIEEKCNADKRDNEDSLRNLKEEIRREENRARKLKEEHDQAQGDSRRIVAGEIERLFRGLDRLRGRENVIAGNLERIGVALAKVAEGKAALKTGVSEEQFDEIALELQDLFGALKSADRAARELDREVYTTPEATPVDAETRMAEVAGEKAPAAELSEETQKRLKSLELE